MYDTIFRQFGIPM